MVLTTERLLLRPILPSDAADMFEYSCHPEVGPNAGWKPHETLEETHPILKEIFLDQEDIFGIQLQTSGKLVGSIGPVSYTHLDVYKRQATARTRPGIGAKPDKTRTV